MTLYSLDDLDAVYYINLAHRTDRKKSLEKTLKDLSIPSEKIIRIKGVLDVNNGRRGCVKSHIKCLKSSLDKGLKNVLILEDDCAFGTNRKEIDEYIYTFFSHYKNNWDVFFLGSCLRLIKKTELEGYVQVGFSTRAHAYIVNGPYIKTLYKNYLETLDSLKEHLFHHTCPTLGLDVQWKALQLKDRWFAGLKMPAYQIDSFSDIEKLKRSEHPLFNPTL